jgi:hypothetical protein
MSRIEDVFLKIGSVDRRWIFLIIAAVVILPLLVPIGLPIRATDTTKDVYDAIERLPAGTSNGKITTAAIIKNIQRLSTLPIFKNTSSILLINYSPI